MKRTAKYYNSAKGKKSYAKKKKYDTKYHKTKARRKYRSLLNKENRKRGTYGNGDGKDYDHAKGKMVTQSVNRGRNSKSGGTSGDKRARG